MTNAKDISEPPFKAVKETAAANLRASGALQRSRAVDSFNPQTGTLAPQDTTSAPEPAKRILQAALSSSFDTCPKAVFVSL